MTITLSADTLPRIIQGGMGVGVSHWSLANAVARTGALGVVASPLLDSLMVRRLQSGDLDGSMRRAIASFPMKAIGDHVLERFYRAGGKRADEPFKLLSIFGHKVDAMREGIAALAAFAEVWLAKEGHEGTVGINLLTKIAPPNPAMLFGAMLAGVDVVIMGAGIPKDVPAVLDAFADGRAASMRWDIEGARPGDNDVLTFDPARIGADRAPMRRPFFLPIVSSNVLATTLARKSSGRVDGFIVEGPTAGGHNAPPRGPMTLDTAGSPIYGVRDVVDLDALRALGLPFWLAGGYATPAALRRAIQSGAHGIQIGTVFAFCRESGLDPALRSDIVGKIVAEKACVFTDPRASPTSYPFKHLRYEGEAGAPERRDRVCDLGYLRTPFRTEAGEIAYRCPAEPVANFVQKGGAAADAEGRVCLCNVLLANVGHPQLRRDGTRESAFLTAGDDIDSVRRMTNEVADYTAADVVRMLDLEGALAGTAGEHGSSKIG